MLIESYTTFMDTLETGLSLVDGAAGRLLIVGHDVEALAGRTSFAGMCGLLLDGRLEAGPGAWAAALGRGRAQAFAALAGPLGRCGALARPDGMDALRAGLGHLETEDPAVAIGAVAVV